MSTTLFFLFASGTLAVAWSLCFVGCNDNFQFVSYSETILSDPNLLAYWPLSDLIGTSATPGTLNMKGQTSGAGDIFDHHDGTYTIPPSYPGGMMSDPIVAPSLTREPSIVPGDANSSKNPLAASVDFEGGFVNIPWSTQNSPTLNDFTLEAWFNPGPAGSGFRRALFAALVPGDTAGFALFIDASNNWQLLVGGTGGTPINTGMPAVSGYVALTFNSSTGVLALWNNPGSDTPSPPSPVWPPDPNQTTSYVAADPNQLTQMFIGAGATEETLRTVDGGPGAPLFPFAGQIQSVALYKTALDPDELQLHFQAGSNTD